MTLPEILMHAKSGSEPVCIVGIGACTAIGYNAASAAAAVRAGITGFHEHPYMIDKTGEKMIVARVPPVPIDLNFADRFTAIAVPALREALAPLIGGRHVHAQRIHVILGLPSIRPGLSSETQKQVCANLLADEYLRSAELLMFTSGHSAGLMALGAGCGQIRAGSADFCLIGGVDSYLEPETLEWLDANEQLHSEANTWGFVPGEAAGFCLLASQREAERLRLVPLCWVLSVATALEPNLINTDTICIGRGLSQSVRDVLAALPSPENKINQTVCDMNGERYRADELAFTICRTASRFVNASDFLSPADCWGDVGAASGPLFISLTVAANAKAYSKGPLSLLWTSSENGERSAAITYCGRTN